MKIENILAIIGVIVGLPSFLLLFCSGQQVIAILVLIIISFLFYYYLQENLTPSFHLISHYKKVEIFDKSGSKAKVTLRRRIRPNHRGLQEYIFRYIRSDGRIENFQSNFGPPHKIARDAGNYVVTIRFPKELKKKKPLEVTLSYDILEGYSQNIETTSLFIDYPAKELWMEIIFPDERPCLEAEAYRITGSDEKEIKKPEISPDHTEIKWNLKKNFGFFARGYMYKIEWEW